MRNSQGRHTVLSKESTIMCVGCRLSTVILTLYKDVPWKGCVEYGFVFLKAKVGGRTVRMQFSLNKGLHLLPHGVYGFPWQSLTREGGSFDRPLSSETVPLYKDVATQIGDFHFVADYRLGYPDEEKVGTLYLDALEGKSFVLNYPKKVIEILE